MKMCAAGLLYRKVVDTLEEYSVYSCIILVESDDDEWSMKAKAERYFNNHSEISKKIAGKTLVAWTFATSDDHYEKVQP